MDWRRTKRMYSVSYDVVAITKVLNLLGLDRDMLVQRGLLLPIIRLPGHPKPHTLTRIFTG